MRGGKFCWGGLRIGGTRWGLQGRRRAGDAGVEEGQLGGGGVRGHVIQGERNIGKRSGIWSEQEIEPRIRGR